MSFTFSVEEILHFHAGLIQHSGGSAGVRDRAGLESAIAQPLASYAGQLLYPEVTDRAAVIGHALIANHPFVDGNKRVGHAAMAVYLRRHGLRLNATVDEQERVILSVAAGEMSRDELREWVADTTTAAST